MDCTSVSGFSFLSGKLQTASPRAAPQNAQTANSKALSLKPSPSSADLVATDTRAQKPKLPQTAETAGSGKSHLPQLPKFGLQSCSKPESGPPCWKAPQKCENQSNADPLNPLRPKAM